MTNHSILMARAQATSVGDRVTVALCTLALAGDLAARRELQAREHGTAVRS